MSNAYVQYIHDPTEVVARWYGGAYIDLGYVDAEGEFHAAECINVYDYERGEAQISTPSDVERVVDEHMTPCSDCYEHGDAEIREEYDEDLCDSCYLDRKDREAEEARDLLDA